MAQKRCFTNKITESDAFLEMPPTTQNLYFHLNMYADDDGFVNSPKKIMRMVGASDDDLKILIAKSFILVFDSGVIVIKHWRLHNTLQNDRYHPTDYQEEFQSLNLKPNKVYTLKNDEFKLLETKCFQNVSKMETELNITKHNLTNIKEEIYKEEKQKYGEFQNVLLTDKEYHKLEQSNLLPYIENLSQYIASKGKRYKSHYATILTWARNDPKNKKLPNWFNKEIENSGELEDKEFEDFIKEFRDEKK